MIELCIYGDEELDDETMALIEDITGNPAKPYLEKLAEDQVKAADECISLLAKLDHRWAGRTEDYYRNAATILFCLARTEQFHEALLKARGHYINLPGRAELLVASQ